MKSKFSENLQITSLDSDDEMKKGGCCGGAGSRERVLVALLVLTVAAATAACVAIAIVVSRQNETTDASSTQSPVAGETTTTAPSNPAEDSICLTPGCVAAAARINDYIDDSVNPCDNFFEYACGNWIRKHPIPEDKSSIDTFGVLRDEVEVTLKALLEAPSEETELSSIRKAKDMYRSCVNVSLIETRGLQVLEGLFAELGGWPVLNTSWDQSGFDLEGMLVKMRLYGYSPLVYYSVSTDAKDSSARIIVLDQPYLIMPGRDYYNDTKSPKSIPALTDYLTNLATVLGNKNSTQVAEDIEAVVAFEKKIATMTIPSEERRDTSKLYNKFTIGELGTNISSKFDWHSYIRDIMDDPGVGIPVGTNESVVVRSPVYLSNLADYLKTVDDNIIANYLIAFMLVDLVNSLPEEVRLLRTAYRKVIYGEQTTRARWRQCVGITRDSMGDAVGRIFVDSDFDENAKDVADTMIQNIRKAFNNLLEEAEWMDDPTREVAEDKAEAIRQKIGYSLRDVKNNTAVEETYKNVDYKPDVYFENILNATIWASQRYLKRLREPVDKEDWFTSPAVVNAFYSSSQNSITFPAGILQPPFFSQTYPKSMNYGGIGLVIGHEITHGFDDRGRQFDKEGNFKEWWTQDVIVEFKKKAQCIIDQYSEYVVPEANMNINGINTQGENIADNGGLRQSYTAYREWVKSQGKEEPKLPGVKLTHTQLFFVNFAQIWCGTMRPENAIQRILTGVHSPGRFRVIGVLHNSEEFSKAFNCAAGDYMNPSKKCRVW